jgi:AbrB family looped-hinge helix DNA binding protein
MFATLSSKGQLTLPKEIRDQLGLGVGSKLDLSVEADGSLRARPLRRGAADLFGLLHDAGRVASTVEQMDAAVGRHLAADDERISGGAGADATVRRARR